MPIVKCDYCGKEVYRRPSDLLKYKKHYCSIDCKSKDQYKNNIIIINDEYAELIIENKKVLIDKQDVCRINNVKWNLFYDETIKGYYVVGHRRKTNGSKTTLRLHRYLLNCPSDMQVDHINRNTLDNRRKNLRCVSGLRNTQNKGFYSNNKSGYKYIHFDKIHKTYCCEIKRFKKMVFHKCLKNLEELIILRDNFIKENINLWQ